VGKEKYEDEKGITGGRRDGSIIRKRKWRKRREKFEEEEGKYGRIEGT
jgi:hypothetical protein